MLDYRRLSNLDAVKYCLTKSNKNWKRLTFGNAKCWNKKLRIFKDFSDEFYIFKDNFYHTVS